MSSCRLFAHGTRCSCKDADPNGLSRRDMPESRGSGDGDAETKADNANSGPHS